MLLTFPLKVVPDCMATNGFCTLSDLPLDPFTSLFFAAFFFAWGFGSVSAFVTSVPGVKLLELIKGFKKTTRAVL